MDTPDIWAQMTQRMEGWQRLGQMHLSAAVAATQRNPSNGVEPCLEFVSLRGGNGLHCHGTDALALERRGMYHGDKLT